MSDDYKIIFYECHFKMVKECNRDDMNDFLIKESKMKSYVYKFILETVKGQNNALECL